MAARYPQADHWCVSDSETIKTSLLWTINKFSELPEKTGKQLISSTFSANNDLNTKWCMYIFPSGEDTDDKDFVGLFIHLKESDRLPVSARMKIGLIDANQRISIPAESKYCFTNANGYGWPQFVKRSQLMSKQLIPNDSLTIYCEVITSGVRKTTVGHRIGFKRQQKSLSDDMKKLLQNVDDTDIEIMVQGHKFSAHKAVLKARSPVFEAMLKHPMKESRQNRIAIRDIDKDVFSRVLRFIYTDKVRNEDIDSNMKLFFAADKYNLDELKSICEEYIGSQLSVEIVSDVLILANYHSAEELKSQAIHFIKTNSNKVTKTQGWKNVIDRPHLLDLL